MVDWSLAGQVARLAAGPAPAAPLEADPVALCAELEGPVTALTRLEPAGAIPEPEVVDRGGWAESALGGLRELLDPVAERLDRRMERAGPLAGALRLGAGAAVAAEAGLAIGYVSHRVLGQYDVSLLGADAPPRLLFVAPNLGRAAEEAGVEHAPFVRWVAAHELTHVLQFQGVPWLRGHLAGLVRDYLASVELRIDSAGGVAPSIPSPARLVEALREGGLAAVVQTPEQRELMGRMQAAMAVVEGYSEHAMDALGERLLPQLARLRAAMDRRRRSRSAPERVVERLLGLDVKLRQYELGRGFCDAVAARAGVEALNRVWDSPEALPDARELHDPELWLARTRRRAPPAGSRLPGAGDQLRQ